MRRATITIPDELEAALERYRGRFAARPSLTAVLQAALESFLGPGLAEQGPEVAEPSRPYDPERLDEATRSAIRHLARTQGSTEQEIIQQALRAFVERIEQPRPRGVGAYRSGRADVAERAEELLWQTAGERE